MTVIAETENTRGNSFSHPEPRPGSWKAAFLAGLPHILMGLLIGTGKLLTTATSRPSQTMSIIAGISLMGLVVVVLFFAWRRGWPLWSASWYGYGTWAAMALISLAISQLELNEDWRYSNALFLGWIGLCIIYGQDWCYDGGEDYYRLGYVYREHWSDPPTIGRIYKTKGEAPDLHDMCEEEIAALRNRYPYLFYEYYE